MKVASLVENTSRQNWPVEHGLSLYIETDPLNVLFDMGQSELFAHNAQRMKIDLNKVHIAVLSHGHYDHGGGLHTFLSINHHAPVYIHKQAFEPHYSLRQNGLHYIGLDTSLQEQQQIKPCQGTTVLNNRMLLFSNIQGQYLCPPGNQLLYGPTPTQHDSFCHEQSLLIEEENKCILFAGCAHTGIINIIQKAENLAQRQLTHVFAGMHLAKSGLSEADEEEFIAHLAHELLTRDSCQYYTMHCTGEGPYAILKKHMGKRIDYLSCGDTIHI